MSMLTLERDRPVHEPDDPRRAAAARRVLSRWVLRLAVREWKQRILIVLLITVATAATLFAIAVASATPGTPNAGIYGTAQTLVQLPGNTPDLPGVIAKIEKAYGAASVIYDQPIVTGQAGGADLRAQDPNAPYTHVLLALDSGRYPTAAGQVAVTSGLAQLYRLRIGSVWHVPASAGASAGRAFTVTGIVENPSNLLDEFALVPPGQGAGLAAPQNVRIFLGISMDSAAASAAGNVIPKNATVTAPQPTDSIVSPATIVLIVSVLGLAFIGLVATAAFTVMAQRRQRALGMLASLGATERDVRFVLIVDGLVAGVLGAIIGAALGLGLWFWYYPHLETATAHRTDPLNLPWAAVVIGLLLAVATSVIAAAWPGRAVSKVPVVAAISGRVSAPHVIRRSLRPGLIFLAAGLFVLYFSGGWNGGGGDAYLVIAALIACVIACALLAPFAVDRLAQVAGRAPLATRLALRDLARYRSRSGAALAAVSFAVFLATIDDRHRERPVRRRARLHRPEHGVQPAHPVRARQRPEPVPAGPVHPGRQAGRQQARGGHARRAAARARPARARPGGQPQRVGARSAHAEPVRGARLAARPRGPAAACTWPLRPCSRRSASARARCNPAADVLTVRAGLPSTGGLALVSGSFIAESPPGCPAGIVHPQPGHPGGRQAARRHLPCRTP